MHNQRELRLEDCDQEHGRGAHANENQIQLHPQTTQTTRKGIRKRNQQQSMQRIIILYWY